MAQLRLLTFFPKKLAQFWRPMRVAQHCMYALGRQGGRYDPINFLPNPVKIPEHVGLCYQII